MRIRPLQEDRQAGGLTFRLSDLEGLIEKGGAFRDATLGKLRNDSRIIDRKLFESWRRDRMRISCVLHPDVIEGDAMTFLQFAGAVRI